jgi:3-oxoacyl-[acyl-carrier protein] reductase
LYSSLKGKAALVTGAASGIGLATAEALARAGATVAMNFLPDDPRGAAALKHLAAEGLSVVPAPADVSRREDAEAMLGHAVHVLGRLDFLVNNAGVSATASPIPFSELDRMTDAFWERILSTNLLGPFHCTRAAAEALRRAGGAVVNTASVAGLGIRGSSLAYAASKAALINMTLNLARALAPEVRVNAVAPGLVASEWTREWPQERIAATADRALLKRICEPADIADAILFLCAGTRMITGQAIVVDGGSLG